MDNGADQVGRNSGGRHAGVSKGVRTRAHVAVIGQAAHHWGFIMGR